MSAAVINAPFNWVNAFQALAVVLRDGTPKGKELAIAELYRMAQTADLAVESVAACRLLMKAERMQQGARDGCTMGQLSLAIDAARTVLEKVKGGQ